MAEEPALSVLQAHLLAGLFAASYVGSLYASQRARITYSSNNADEQARERERRRDDPDVIKARLTIVSLVTLLSCVVVLAVVWALSKEGAPIRGSVFSYTARLLGLSSQNVILPSLIAPALFAGPLYVCYLEDSLPLQRRWTWQWSVVYPLTSLMGLRNYIIAPITEEVVFRACMLAAYHMAGSSSKKMIFVSPLWFGLAHAHHGWEVYHRLGCTKVAAQRAIVSVVFQTAYTTLFGFHCAFLFLRTGSILPPIASHMFCNFMGLPGFGSDLAQHPTKRPSIILAYLLGVAGYVYTLSRWTLAPTSPYWH